MHTIKLNIQDSVFDKVIYFLNHLPSNEVEIVEETLTDNRYDLEIQIDKGLSSGISENSHEEIMNTIKSKYA